MTSRLVSISFRLPYGTVQLHKTVPEATLDILVSSSFVFRVFFSTALIYTSQGFVEVLHHLLERGWFRGLLNTFVRIVEGLFLIFRGPVLGSSFY